jgi:hypothetical protein
MIKERKSKIKKKAMRIRIRESLTNQKNQKKKNNSNNQQNLENFLLNKLRTY